MGRRNKIDIGGKDLELLHYLIANAQCHLLKKSYLFKIDKDALEFSKDLQGKVNRIRSEEYDELY
jgi:hypothetical protein